jgi:hypothetical protein
MSDVILIPLRDGGDSRVAVRMSPHAIERYNERVRPALGTSAAAAECTRIAQFAELRAAPPSWLPPTSQRPAFYLCLDGIAMPADPDPVDRERLLVRTVLTRSGDARPERRIARRRRRQTRAAERSARRERATERVRGRAHRARTRSRRGVERHRKMLVDRHRRMLVSGSGLGGSA